MMKLMIISIMQHTTQNMINDTIMQLTLDIIINIVQKRARRNIHIGVYLSFVDKNTMESNVGWRCYFWIVWFQN